MGNGNNESVEPAVHEPEIGDVPPAVLHSCFYCVFVPT
jgi:hypothetical protein